MQFYKKTLRKFRELRGATQQEVADAIGVTKQSVSNWENEKRPHKPSKKNIIELAKFLNIAVIGLAEVDPTDDCKRRELPPFNVDSILNDNLSMEMLKMWSTMTKKERLQGIMSLDEIIANRPPLEPEKH